MVKVADLPVIRVGINIAGRKLFINNISIYSDVLSSVVILVMSMLNCYVRYQLQYKVLFVRLFYAIQHQVYY